MTGAERFEKKADREMKSNEMGQWMECLTRDMVEAWVDHQVMCSVHKCVPWTGSQPPGGPMLHNQLEVGGMVGYA